MSKIEDRLNFVGLDLDARAVLRGSSALVIGALPIILDEFLSRGSGGAETTADLRERDHDFACEVRAAPSLGHDPGWRLRR